MTGKSCAFSSLPYTADGPPFNAWGLYPESDELGRLNLITPATRLAGTQEVREGLAINLNMPLDTIPVGARKGLVHKILNKPTSNDDEVEFNTQATTQWDGFRHYPYQNWPAEGEKTWYNGMKKEQSAAYEYKKYGVHNYAYHPISSRAHLLDIPLYLSKHNLPPLKPLSRETPVKLEWLQACAAECNVVFRPGDILLVRIGWTEAYLALSEDERRALKDRKPGPDVGQGGVEQGEEMLKWHWDNGIAAVVGDTMAYEVWPSLAPVSCHEVFLAGWGMPIGELFDLRELAAACAERKRWTFFFTSMPLNVIGGIASPPNAQAIL